jgi:hypothetical protein
MVDRYFKEIYVPALKMQASKPSEQMNYSPLGSGVNK